MARSQLPAALSSEIFLEAYKGQACLSGSAAMRETMSRKVYFGEPEGGIPITEQMAQEHKLSLGQLIHMAAQRSNSSTA